MPCTWRQAHKSLSPQGMQINCMFHRGSLLTVMHVLSPNRLPQPRGLIVEVGDALFEWCKLQVVTIEPRIQSAGCKVRS
jgi:hypothetical protein